MRADSPSHSHAHLPTRLLEGPAAEFCDNPILAYRKEVQEYLRSCEHFFAPATSFPPLSEEELSMLKYYAAEIQKILAVPTATHHFVSSTIITAPTGVEWLTTAKLYRTIFARPKLS